MSSSVGRRPGHIIPPDEDPPEPELDAPTPLDEPLEPDDVPAPDEPLGPDDVPAPDEPLGPDDVPAPDEPPEPDEPLAPDELLELDAELPPLLPPELVDPVPLPELDPPDPGGEP